MKKNKTFARVKSLHFENMFEKDRIHMSQEEIEDITSELIDLNESSKSSDISDEYRLKVIKMLDFIVSCSQQLDVSGSELFSMYLNKENLLKNTE